MKWNKAEANMRHFRTFEDISKKPQVSQVGIQGRYISGSGQFTGTNISQLTDKVKEVAQNAVDKIIVIDTRLESHGFINDLPVEWKVKNSDANAGKNADEILNDERSRLLEILQNAVINETAVNKVATEEELVAANGFEYVRLSTLDHSKPNDDTVDAFLELIKNNPNAWLHVHCHVGKGRTTIFMALYDMFYNAKQLDFKEILARNKQIGGEDFEKYLKKPASDQRKWNLADARLDFLKRFYLYCRESDPQSITWQTWVQQQ